MERKKVNLGNKNAILLSHNVSKLEINGKLGDKTSKNKKKLCSMALASIAMITMLVGIAGAAPYAYITNTADRTVSVIDTATDIFVKDINVGSAPFGVAVNPGGTRAYVTNQDSYDVSVINTITNTVIDTVPLGSSPVGAAMNPTGTEVYVAQTPTSGDGAISVIDTATNTVTTTVSVGESPCGVAVNPKEPKLYVANYMDSSVSVIDTNSDSVAATVTVGSGPKGVTVNPTGTRVYVANNAGGTVSVIDTETNTVIDIVDSLNDPEGVAVSPDGKKVFVTNPAEGTVSVIDTDSNIATDVVSGLNYPEGVAVNPDGTKIYVASFGSNNVYVIDTATNTVLTTLPVGNFPYAFGHFIGGQAVQPVLPVTNFSSNVTSGNAPLIVQFNDSSENADNVTWDFGDRANSTEQNPIHVYSEAGIYTVNLTASNANGTDSKTAIINVSASQSGFNVGRYAYITNSGSHNVSVIDTEANTVLASVPVGNTPWGVAVNPDGKKVYVTNSGNNNVSVINTTSNTVTATANVGDSPWGVAINPEGTNVYVTNYLSNNVSIIDTATNTVIATLNVGANPNGVAVSPDGKKVYVANTGEAIVSVIDATDNTITANVSVGDFPYGLAVNPAGTRVYVANMGSNNVSVIDTKSNTIIDSVPVGETPQGVAVSPDGTKAYVTNSGSNNVSIIDITTNTVTDTVDVGDFPYGVSVSADGMKVYVANGGGNTVSVINTTTNIVEGTITVGSNPYAFGQFINPPSTPKESVFPVANFSSNVTSGNAPLAVQFNDSSENATGVSWDFNNDGTPDSTDKNPVYVYTTPGNYTVNLTVTNANGSNSTFANITVSEPQLDHIKYYAYITNLIDNNISVIDTETNTVTATVEGLNSPIGVAVSPDGTKVYVANNGNTPGTVSVINITSKAIIASVDVGTNPFGVAVTPDGKKVYVTNQGGNTVSVINTTTNTITATITVGNTPDGVAVTPDGKKVYVRQYNGNVSIIDTASDSIIATVDAGIDGTPNGVTVRPDGKKVYVTNWQGHNISVIDTATNDVTSMPLVNSPCGAIFNPTGTKLYVINVGSGNPSNVSVIDTVTNNVEATVDVGIDPFGISITPDGKKVYVANFLSNNVSVIDTTSNTVIDTVDVGTAPFAFGKFIYSLPPQLVFPVANFSSNVTIGNAPLTVQFNDSSENADNITWDFGDGNNTTEQNPVHVFSTVGNYIVNLTATNSNGTNSTFATITVSEQPVLSYTIDKIVADVAGKGPSGSVSKAGETITYQVKVTNDGNIDLKSTDLTNLNITDSQTNLIDPIQSKSEDLVLEVGEYVTYTGKYTVTQADIDSAGGGDGFVNNTVAINSDQVGLKSDSADVLIDTAGVGPYAYITNMGDDTVSVINTATNTITAIVAVGRNPYGVVVNPAKTKIYVTNYGNNTVSVIDTSTNNVIATVPVGNYPAGIAVSLDGTKVYVTNVFSNTVSVIDTTSNTVTDTVPVGINPAGVAVNPNGTEVYVTNFNNNTVSVIDRATNTVTATVPVGVNPCGVAVSPDGSNVYVTNSGDGTVDVIYTYTNEIIKTIPVGNDPRGILVNPAGTNVYIANNGSDTVSVINTTTNNVADTVNVGNYPYGVSVNPNGTEVFVTNYGSNTVSVIDTIANNVIDTINVGVNPVAFGQFIYSFPMPPVLPVANFSSNVTSGNVPLAVQFNDNSENATDLRWEFDYDGTPNSIPGSIDKNPIHVYEVPGTYTVNLTASNANGTDSKVATINVLKAVPEINWSNPEDIVYGTALNDTQLNAEASVSGNIVYTPAKDAVLGVGKHILQANFTPEDSANFSSASKNVSINVLKATPEINWSNPADITYGIELNKDQLNAEASVSGNLAYNPAQGTISGVGVQILDVDFTPDDTANYTNASKNVSINILQATPEINWNNLADIVYGTALNDTQLNAETSVNGTFVYTPTNGTVLGVGTHTLNVDFAPEDSANYSSVSKNISINVLSATPEITWNNPADITYGTELNEAQLDASALVNGTFVYNPTEGTLLGVGTQTLQVDFAPEDSANYTNAPKNVTINVLQTTPEINWSNPGDIIYGTELNNTQLNANASVPGIFVYTPDVGTVLGIGTQTLNVDFTPEDIANYSSVSKNITINVLQATPEITWSDPEDIVYGTALNDTQLNAEASVKGQLTYTPDVGNVLGVGTHTLEVDFTPADTANYSNVSKSVSINVLKATPEINWSNPDDVVYGTALNYTQLNAEASVKGTSIPGNFNYNPEIGAVLGAGNQTLHVDFAPEDSVNYNNALKNVSINVTKVTPEITWNKPEDIVYETALSSTQLNASSVVKGQLTYTPDVGTVLGVGQHTLNVDLRPEDTANYTTASRNVSINVTKATPEITWNKPEDIVYRTALNDTQLNAEASVNGTFVYNPAEGTIIGIGEQILNVNFTPEDTANYTNASKSVSINVLNTSYSIFKSVIAPDETGDCIVNSAGDKIPYRIVVKNEGDENLTNVTVNDSIIILTGPVGNDIDPEVLNPGETWIYTGIYKLTSDDINNESNNISNTATVSCNELPEKSSSVDTPIAKKTDLSIYKSVIGIDEAGDYMINEPGDLINYQVAVRNNGNVKLTGISVNDPMVKLTGPTGDHNKPGILDPGETWVYTGNYTVTQMDIDSNGNNYGFIENTATVSCKELSNESSSKKLPIIRILPVVVTPKSNDSNALPTVDFNTNTTSGNAPLSVQFTDFSQNAALRSWDFNNDGTADSIEVSSVYTYTAPGTYTANLTVSNANGNVSKNATITVLQATSSSSSSGRSSSSGSSNSGGTGGSSEPAYNIEVKEISQAFITSGSSVKFDFPKNATAVVYLSFDSKKTAGKTATIVENLRGKSTFVSELPSDEVYKSLNIWVGNSGFATPNNIENAVVCFKVEKTWIQDKKIDKSSITLNRYSDKKWEQLLTSLLKEDDKYLYFTAKTPGFSPFSITGKSTTGTEIQSATSTQSPEQENENTAENAEQTADQRNNTSTLGKGSKRTPGFGILCGITGLLAVFMYRRKTN